MIRKMNCFDYDIQNGKDSLIVSEKKSKFPIWKHNYYPLCEIKFWCACNTEMTYISIY